VPIRIPVSVLLSSLLFAFSAPAAAQRLTIAGQVGTTFQIETAPVFAGEVGIGLVPGVSIYGTLGRMQDVTPSGVADLLDGLGDFVDFSIPAVYGVGGVRVGLPVGVVRPYGVAGIGFARLSANAEVLGFDVTNLIEDQIGLELETNELAYELGGGVMFSLGPNAFLDAGYRYMRINSLVDFDVSRVYGGLGVRF
jgi:hypothetical protein